MSDFAKNENKNWQQEVRAKIEDLQGTLAASNNEWNAWELEFIEDMVSKLEQDIINVSPKQYQKIWDLWERI